MLAKIVFHFLIYFLLLLCVCVFMDRDTVVFHRQTKTIKTNIQAFLQKALGQCLKRISYMVHVRVHVCRTPLSWDNGES